MKAILKQLLELAKEGNALAQYKIALFFESKEDFESTNKLAVKWMKYAAEQGLSKAQWNLGLYYKNGILVSHDSQKMLYWLNKSAGQKNKDALIELQHCYENGIGVTMDIKKALRYEEILSEMGITEFTLKLGRRFFSGHGVEPDLEIACLLFKDIAEQSIIASIYLGNCMYYGLGTEQNMNAALKVWSTCKSAINGIISDYPEDDKLVEHYCQPFNNRHYLGYDSNVPDYELTLKRCKHMLMFNSSFALYRLGVMCFKGYGVKQDAGTAEDYLLDAARMGNELAQSLLTKIYSKSNYKLYSK